jgi:hypothetical protein
MCPWHPGEKTSSWITQLQDSTTDMRIIPDFVQLTYAHNVAAQARYKMHL